MAKPETDKEIIAGLRDALKQAEGSIEYHRLLRTQSEEARREIEKRMHFLEGRNEILAGEARNANDKMARMMMDIVRWLINPEAVKIPNERFADPQNHYGAGFGDINPR